MSTDLGGVTAVELARICEIDPQVVRYHCRTGVLSAVAVKVGRDWMIPTADAERFARGYTPYGSLSKAKDAGAESAPAS